MGDFEAEVVNSFKAINSQVNALDKNVTKANSSTTLLGRKLKREFDDAKKAADESDKSQNNFTKGIQQSGQALSKFGGPLGEIVSKLTGGLGLSAGMARVAAGAALLAVGMKAVNAVTDMNIQRTKLLIEARKELRDITIAAVQAERQQGVSAVQSQGQELLLLNSRGGQAAIDQANKLSEKGFAPASDIRKGVATALGFESSNPGESSFFMQQRALRVAEQVSSAGEGGFDQTVKAALSDPYLLSRLGTKNGENEVAESLVAKSRGVDDTETNRAMIRRDLDRANYNALPTKIAEVRGLINQKDVVGQDRIVSGQAALAAREDLAKEKSPETAAVLELFRRQQEGDSALRELATQQGKTLGLLADIFKPDGSFETQLRRLAIARGGASFGD